MPRGRRDSDWRRKMRDDDLACQHRGWLLTDGRSSSSSALAAHLAEASECGVCVALPPVTTSSNAAATEACRPAYPASSQARPRHALLQLQRVLRCAMKWERDNVVGTTRTPGHRRHKVCFWTGHRYSTSIYQADIEGLHE